MLRRLAMAAFLGIGVLVGGAARAGDLLLPYFEVDLEAGRATTVFALANSEARPVEALATVRTNRGVPVLSVPIALAPRQALSFDLRDWLVSGRLPGRVLAPEELAHLQAALSGQASPVDGLYYASPSGRAEGSILFESPGELRGEASRVETGRRISRRQPLTDAAALCTRHAVFLASGTGEAVLWSDTIGQPAPDPDAADWPRRRLSLEKVSLAADPRGWIEIETAVESFVAAWDADGRPLETMCADAKKPKPPKIPKISLLKLINNRDVKEAPGPSVQAGSRVLWFYQVTNSGKVELRNIRLFDDQEGEVVCPSRTLKPGRSMSCEVASVAKSCQYSNTAIVTGTPARGAPVTAEDTSWYFGDEGAAVRITVSTNGDDANDPRGPVLPVGSRIEWTYDVENTGKVRLTAVSVSDDHGLAVICPRTSLGPGEAMTCTATGFAAAGQYRNVGTVTAKSTCRTVTAQDPSHYWGEGDTGIRLRLLVNGQDANQPPGPSIPAGGAVTWEYQVTNSGKLFLSQVRAQDDRGLEAGCPKTTLSPGETMVCNARGVAAACQQSLYGTAAGLTSGGQQVSASDPAYYLGQAPSAIQIESSANGSDADSPPGPTVTVGLPVSMTYLVTNTGKVALTGISVSDDKGTSATCGKTELRPGETMVCSATVAAAEGQVAAIATASGLPPCGPAVIDTDPVHYFGRTGGADDTAQVAEDTPPTAINVLANDGGVSGTFKIVSVTQPANGRVAITLGGAALTYQPAADYCNTPPGSSPDLFTYTTSPGGATLTVAVSVQCVDDAPAGADDLVTVSEGAAPTLFSVIANDTDVDAGPKAIASATQPAHGTVAVLADGLGLTYQPNAAYCNNPPGTTPDTFTYTLAPGDSTATVSVLVNCVDDPPAAVDDTAALNEDSGPLTIDVLSNDKDPDGGVKQVDAVSQPLNGQVSIAAGGSGVIYQPKLNYCSRPPATDNFTYTLAQGGTATVAVTVNCVDDPPVAVDDTPTVNEDAKGTTFDVLANDSDVDGGPKTIASVTQPSNGTVTLADGGLGVIYQPAAGYCNAPGGAPDTFLYSIAQGGSTATVRVVVNCSDNSPVPVDDTVTVAEDSAATVVDVLANDSDPDGGPKALAATTPAGNGTVAIQPDGLKLTYRPDPGYCNKPPGTAPDTFTYTVTPGNKTGKVSVFVTCTDDAPTAVDDVFTINEDAGLNVLNVLANDTDPDGGTRTIASATDPPHGTVSVSAGTSLTYRPGNNYCNLPGGQADTFSYTLNPGGDTATVSVQVNCLNDPPTADNESFETIGNTELVVDLPAVATPHVRATTASGVGVLEGDGDIDGNGLQVSRIVGCPATSPLDCDLTQGKIRMEPTGQFSFTPKGVQNSPTTYSFQYEVSDGQATATGTVTITPRQRVWYVKHDAAATGTGVSNDPFNSLTKVPAVHKANDYIFVHYGSAGTSVGDLALLTGERLLGEHTGLTVANGVNGGATVLVAPEPGSRPQAGTISGTNVLPAEIAGVSPDAISLQTSGTGTMSIRDNVVRTSGASVSLNNGSLDLAVSSNTFKTTVATGNALFLNGTGGTLKVTDFADNTVDPATTGSGVSITRATFDATPDGAVQRVDAGALSIGTTADRVGKNGLVLTNTGGSVLFSNLQIATAGGAGLKVDDSGLTTGITLAVAPNVAQIDARSGPAVEINKAAVDLRLVKASSSNSTTSGISLTAVTGTFSAESTSVIDLPQSATGSAFLVSGSNAAVTYKGEISGGRGISLQSNNAATTISFTGHINVDTGTTGAFAAASAGTVTVTGTDNRLQTTTGIPLNVTQTTIGTQGLVFEQITSDGASNGIVVTAAGTSGGLTVARADIRNTTSDAISLTGLQNVSLDLITIKSSMTNGIYGNNLSGTVAITNSLLELNLGNGIMLLNGSASIGHLILTNNTIDSDHLRTSNLSRAIYLQTSGGAGIAKATVANNKIDYTPGLGIQISAGNVGSPFATTLGDPAGGAVTIDNNDIVASFGSQLWGIDIGFKGCNGKSNLIVSRNKVESERAEAIRYQAVSGTCTSSALNARLEVTGNTVDRPLTGGAGYNGILVQSTVPAAGSNSFCLRINSNNSAGSGGKNGIGLDRAASSVFNIYNLTGDATTFVNAQNPQGGGTNLLTETSGFGTCN